MQQPLNRKSPKLRHCLHWAKDARSVSGSYDTCAKGRESPSRDGRVACQQGEVRMVRFLVGYGLTYSRTEVGTTSSAPQHKGRVVHPDLLQSNKTYDFLLGFVETLRSIELFPGRIYFKNTLFITL